MICTIIKKVENRFTIPVIIDNVRETRWNIILIVMIIQIILPHLSFNVLFNVELFHFIQNKTNGLFQITLLLGLIALLLIVGGVILWAGKLRLQDVGILKSRFPIAVIIIITLWILSQLIMATVALINNKPLAIHTDWNRLGISFMLGLLAAQLFGNALFEEIVFRGFLLPQLYLKFSAKNEKQKMKCLVMAVLVSQIYFALIHIPFGLYKGRSLFIYIFGVALLGIIFALVYLRTENLFLAVGLHALNNKPTPIINSTFETEPYILIPILIILLLLCWPFLKRRYKLNSL